MSGFEVVGFRAEHRDAVVELRRRAYHGGFPEAREYLAWKYEQNPWMRDGLLYVALDGNGTVCGMRGAYGTAWDTPRGTVLIPCLDDFSIAHEHRNSGLMTTMMRFVLDDLARRGHEFLLNTSGGRVTALQSLAMGWKSAGAMEPVARLGRRARLRGALQGRLQGRRVVWRLARPREVHRHSDARVFQRLDRAGGATARDGVAITVGAQPRPDAMAELAARLPHDARIRHVRDRAFFAWRFRNPSREYRFLFAGRDGALRGWLALSRHYGYTTPILPFQLADLAGEDAVVRAELLRRALAWGRFAELGAWAGTLDAEDRALLARAGFRPDSPDLRARGLPCVLIKRLGGTGAWSLGGVSATDPQNWEVRLIDSMHA